MLDGLLRVKANDAVGDLLVGRELTDGGRILFRPLEKGSEMRHGYAKGLALA